VKAAPTNAASFGRAVLPSVIKHHARCAAVRCSEISAVKLPCSGCSGNPAAPCGINAAPCSATANATCVCSCSTVGSCKYLRNHRWWRKEKVIIRPTENVAVRAGIANKSKRMSHRRKCSAIIDRVLGARHKTASERVPPRRRRQPLQLDAMIRATRGGLRCRHPWHA